MGAYLITDRQEYQYCIQKGHQPLLDIRNFQLEIGLRIEIQREIFGHCIFGRGNIPAANERFFRWVWEHKPHYCEETMRPLNKYSAVYCSHIITRGSHPEMSHDPRNINILSLESHNRWENGDRQNMRIYKSNIQIIELLKREYQSI